MPRFIDLSNKKIEAWMVSDKYQIKNNRIYWECTCECGTTKLVSGKNLNNKLSTNCGCRRIKHSIENNVSFGKLRYTGNQTLMRKEGSNNRTVYEFKCDCGNIVYHPVSALQRGNIKSCGCTNYEKTSHESLLRQHYDSYIKGAEKRKLMFSLSMEQFELLIMNNCAYCGIEPTIKKSRKPSGVYLIANGIDRVDNNIGYEINNCVSCCGDCNYAKRRMTKSKFLTWIKRVYNFNFNKGLI